MRQEGNGQGHQKRRSAVRQTPRVGKARGLCYHLCRFSVLRGEACSQRKIYNTHSTVNCKARRYNEGFHVQSLGHRNEVNSASDILACQGGNCLTGRSPAAQRGNEPRPQQQSTDQRGADGAQRTQGESTQQTPRRRATQLLEIAGQKQKWRRQGHCNELKTSEHGPRHRPKRRGSADAKGHGANGARQGAAQGRARAEEAAQDGACCHHHGCYHIAT
mmetsp:Transcript_55465/g.121404  ORF Transcript_55465/g.121404 Transcript_55465/m.121404 type:complete len:218 (-) Transcript_55465:349-1002(-)